MISEEKKTEAVKATCRHLKEYGGREFTEQEVAVVAGIYMGHLDVVEQASSGNSGLLPCPFCGSTEIESGESLSVRNMQYYLQTGCTNCGALGPVKRVPSSIALRKIRGEANDADNAWNIRAR